VRGNEKSQLSSRIASIMEIQSFNILKLKGKPQFGFETIKNWALKRFVGEVSISIKINTKTESKRNERNLLL